MEASAITDLFLFDLKVMDEAKHQRLVGVPLAPVLENLEALDDTGAAIWIRFPLIPGVNDGMENVAALGRKIVSLRTRRVHILPFHRTAADKYSRIERDWLHSGAKAVSDKRVAEAAGALEAMGLDVVIGG
jgi:pyruvate formate lyase activating enzyme